MGGPSATSPPPPPPLAPPILADEDSDEPQSPELRNGTESVVSPDVSPVAIPGAPAAATLPAGTQSAQSTPSPEFLPRRRRRSLQAQKRLRALSDDDDDYQEHTDDDNDSDGYERGTMRHEDSYHAAADEHDELFLTPRRPGRASITQGGSHNGGGGGETLSDRAGGGEYATFDPILALLDEHWTLLRLSAEEDTPPSESEPVPEYLAPLDSVLPDLASAAVSRSERDRDRHVMAAVRDADILDASCAAYQQECETLRTAADTARRKATRLAHENKAAALEIGALHEAMATLQAARDVDARVNAILAQDQAAEIKALQEKLGSVDKRRSCSRSPSASSSVSDADADAEIESDENKDVETEAEKQRLIEHKNRMFKEYEKRHSVSIQHMVRRSSQMLLASARAGAQGQAEETKLDLDLQLEPSTSPVPVDDSHDMGFGS